MRKNTSDSKIQINGKRILLRRIRLSDVNISYLRWMNDPEVNKYLESRFTKWTIRKLAEYIKRLRHDPDTILFAIILKVKEAHIGNIKIGPINRMHKFADIGLVIGDKNSWGKGYATEAIKLVSKYAFNSLNLHKITAGAYKENIGSIKAFQKSGYIIEGTRKKQFISGSDYTDEILLSKTKQ